MIKKPSDEEWTTFQVRLAQSKGMGEIAAELAERAEAAQDEAEGLALATASGAVAEKALRIAKELEDLMGVDPNVDIDEQIADYLGQVGDGNRSVGARSKDGTA